MTEEIQANFCGGVLDQPEPAVGNYFVSTYPPFSTWTEEAVADYQHLLQRPPAPATQKDTPLGLYVHIPFCVDRCQYCYYLSYDGQLQEIDGYLDAVIDELAQYSRLPAIADRPLSFVYFGGGTPSILSVPRIRKLMEGLHHIKGWDHALEVSFECAPRSVTRGTLKALRDCGVTRISLGVQQMDDTVLQANGRVHLIADVERAYRAIQDIGFHTTNLDLMVGLVKETEESFLASLDRIIEMRPESVTTYQLEIPLNTPLYQSIRDGSLDSDLASWEQKHARLQRGMARLEAAGYTMRSAYTAVLDVKRYPFVYQDQQYHGADLLGIGTSAFSYIGGIHQQNQASLQRYLEASAGGELPHWRAHVLSDEERLVREFILQLKLGRVRRDDFRQKFGVDVVSRFAEPLQELEQKGWLEVTEDAVAMTREGLVRVDRILGAFYLPAHRGVRYS